MKLDFTQDKLVNLGLGIVKGETNHDNTLPIVIPLRLVLLTKT